MSDPKDESDEELESGFSLSSILFGNVDKNGELIDGFLDKDTSKHLRSLDQLNIASGLIDEIREDVRESIQDAKNKEQSTDEAKADDKAATKEATEENYSKKDDDAVDYSDENEMADDQTSEDDIKFKEALSELVFKMPTAPISKPPSSAQQQQKKKLDEDDDYDSSDSDTRSTSERAAAAADSKTRPAAQQKASTAAARQPESGADKVDPTNTTAADDEASKEAAISAANKKRLDTPLAEMLPSKYADYDVTNLFPEFRPNKTLRFSRLFVASKQSLLPNPWKGVKNKKRKKKRTASENAKDVETGKEHPKETVSDDAVVPFDESAVKQQKTAEDAPFQLKFGETANPDEVEEDQEEMLKRPLECKNFLNSDDDLNGDFAQKVAHWRNGPAAFWYSDMFVPEASKIFDFGFKKRQQQPDEDSEEDVSSEEIEDDVSDHSLEDCYHMVTQGQWEDEIIWNGEDCKQKILAKNTEKYNAAGWVPSGANRTASAFIKQVRGSTLPSLGQKPSNQSSLSTHSSSKKDKNKDQSAMEAEKDETWYSMFPAENEELIYGIWEGDVIWDADNLNKIPEPKILTLDPNDENIVLGIPDDVDPSLKVNEVKVPIPLKEKKEHHLKKSRILLGKAGVIAEPEPESPPPTEEEKDKDPYNISNDDYYNPKLVQTTALKPTVGVNLIQHSIPALELRPIFFPTYMGPIKLRTFHRPPLKRYSHGTVADSLSHPVIPLLKHMKKKAKQREQERLAAGGGDMFFMRTPEDLSGKDGDLILYEYSEEHPPLMMQVGMATKIKNYYKRRPGKDAGAPEHEYGETVYAHTTPFLGNLAPGHSLQAVENNLFRAPIFNHHLPDTDFLIIRTRNNYFIRNVETIFTVGQQLPLYEVPGPNSKKANNFIRDFLQVFIYRLFWSSTDTPRRIKMEDIKKAFPSHSESSIRKRLKLCADFKRTGSHSNWWVLKPDFRLPTEEEMRAMVSPEQCCAFYSMIAAEQRLKDAGYGEKTLFTAEDENDEDQQLKMDDEVKTAPWNTTRAFIAAMKGKCLLQLNGAADPTGCGEGFSYVRIPNKPQISKEDIIKQQEPKKTVTGTDADLRRLPLSAAKNLLRKHNVPEEEIKKLSRWEVIDVVRTLSTAQAKAGAETMSKFARGNRFSIAEHQERYKEEAQRIFELQNRLLASAEEMSTDDEESDDNEEEMDYEEMGKSIENIIANKKTSQQLSLEKEEEERRELRKLMLMGEDSNPGDSKKKGQNAAASKQPQQQPPPLSFADDEDSMSNQGKLLKIYRTYRNADGKEYIRIETVRKPNVITAYVKLRQTKDPDQIKKFTLALDEQEKEEYRKVKRRLQEQLRRLKRNAEKNKAALNDQPYQHEHQTLGRPMKLSLSDEPVNDFGIGVNTNSSMYDDPSLTAKAIGPGSLGLSGENGKKNREKKEKEKKESKVRCGNCGGTGHMKTNRICPLYSGELPPITVAMTEKEEQEQKTILERDDLIKVDDTKLIFSKALFNHEEEVRKKSLILKVPREVMKRKRRLPTDDYCDYLEKPDYKQANRRRKDPLVSLSITLDEIISEIRVMPGSEIFMLPVSSKKVKDYYNIITKPMDIQTIKKKTADRNYFSRDDFLGDWLQIYENSRLYNGPNHQLTAIAQQMHDLVKLRCDKMGENIAQLERTINPLLDNDQVAFSYILESVILPRLRNVPESWAFHKPVNKKNVKDYYEIIKTPIDLETMLTNVKEHRYHSRQQFMSDLQLMYENAFKFNGEASPITKKGLELIEVAKQCMEEHDEKLKELEAAILANKAAALDGDDSESVVTGGLSNPDLLDENSSLADGDYRSESRAESAKNEYYGEINASDYEENSQSGLSGQAVHRGQQDAMQYEQMLIDNADNEDIVYDNYDPSKFLLDQFHQPAAMFEDDEEKSSSNNARPFEAIGRQQQVEPEEMANSNSRGVQEESNDMRQQQQAQSSNFEQDFAMSDDSDDSINNKMEIDNKSDNDSNDDDIWF